MPLTTLCGPVAVEVIICIQPVHLQTEQLFAGESEESSCPSVTTLKHFLTTLVEDAKEQKYHHILGYDSQLLISNIAPYMFLLNATSGCDK